MRHSTAILALLVACASTIATSAPVPAEVEARKQIAKLSDDAAGVRFAAAVELGRLGHRISVGPLLAVLADDTDVFVRGAAARALGQIGDVSAVPGLIDALADREIFVASQASRALRDLTGVSHGFAPELTAEQRRAVQEKWRAWWKNRRTSKKPADPAPRQQGKPALDPVALVEVEARKQLAKLSDDAAGVRFAATVELGRLGHRISVGPLLAVLADDTDVFVRRAAARALGQIGDGSAVPGLIDALADREIFVATQASRALRDLTGVSHGFAPELTAEQRTAVQEKWRAWWKKRRTSKKPAEPARRSPGKPALDPVALVERLASDSANERFQAAVELGRLRYVRAVTPLGERLATDRDYFVRRACARALGEIHKRQAVPALIGALTDKEIFVALEAARSLKKITGRRPGISTVPDGPDGGTTADPKKRLRIQKRFRAWWEKTKKPDPEDGAADR